MSYQYGTKGGPLHSAQVGGLPRRKVAVISGKLESTTVLTVDGSSSYVGVPRPGSNGGYFTVSSDGTWHFDPGSYFTSMAIDEERNTRIACTINDGYNDINVDIRVIVSSYNSLWTPADITTALWLDAADSATITLSGSKVTQWSDKSGNGRHVTQGTDSLRPTLGTNKIVFGGSHWLQNDTASLPLSEFVLAVVFRETTAVANAAVLSVRGSRNDYESTDGLLFGPSDKKSFRCICTGSTPIRFDVRDTASPTDACPLAVYVIDKGVASGSFYRDGNLLATSSSFTAFAASSLGGVVIGSRQLPSTPTSPYLNGEIMEIMYAPAADRQKLEGYLAHKWGLAANLPSDHPYKSAAPTL